MSEIPSPSEIAWLNLTGAVLLTDRVPDGLELEERRDLPRALGVRLPVDDPLDVVCRGPLEVGRVAVGAREVEGVDVHVGGEPRGELAAPAREAGCRPAPDGGAGQ